jgi:hypothetical protein
VRAAACQRGIWCDRLRVWQAFWDRWP